MGNRIEHSYSDQQLVSMVLHADRNAFSIIIKNTEALVAQIVFKMIANSEDRRDLAQDIYLKAFKNLAGFKFNSKLSTWIAQIAYNSCLNYLEKKKLVLVDNFESVNDSDDEVSGFHRHQSFTNPTEEIIHKKEVSKILASEIEKLSPLYRTLIALYHNEQMSYQEISNITSLPEGTVKSYLFRSRKILKENLLSKYEKEAL